MTTTERIAEIEKEAADLRKRQEALDAKIAALTYEAVIRCMDFADRYGIDLEAAIVEKLAYNETRGYRHGGKRL